MDILIDSIDWLIDWFFKPANLLINQAKSHNALPFVKSLIIPILTIITNMTEIMQ